MSDQRSFTNLEVPLLQEVKDEVGSSQNLSTIEAPGESLFARNNLPLVLGMVLLSFVACTLVSIVGPFVPGELSKVGATETVIGVAFAVYPLALVVGSPIAGAICTRYGQASVLFFGVALEGGTSILSGYFHHLASTDAGRVLVFVVLRFVQGCGAAASYTAICARLADTFPNKLGQAMGLQEAAAGLGFMMGPVFGAFLYEAGGFPLPFLVLGGAVLASLVVLPCALYQSSPIRDVATQGEHLEDGGQAGEVAKPPGFLASLANPGVITGALVTVITGIGLGFTGPTLTGHLEELLDVGKVGVGIIFAIPAAFYIIASTLSGYAADRYGHHFIMLVGLVGMAMSYIFMGPAPFLNAVLPQTRVVMWASQVLSLAMLGITAGMALIPCMPHMLNSLRAAGCSNASEISAGVFSSAYSMGEFLGPLVGGFLTHMVDFEWATVIIAFSVVAVALLTVFDSFSKRCASPM